MVIINDEDELERERENFILEKIHSLGKSISPAKFVAVTKNARLKDAKIIYDSGHFDLGESRLEQLQERSQFFLERSMKNVRWHFIGNIQSNKLNRLLKIPNLFCIHSIHSQKILKSLYRNIDLLQGEKLNYFLQIKTSLENEKSGIENDEELSIAMNFILENQTPKLHFQGLMTMAPIRTNDYEKETQKSFQKLYQIKKRLLREYQLGNDFLLSMGMSRDYREALAAGSDWVRIGSSLYPLEI